ncbi:MAG: Glu/Leu/Phe/Val dehydrogenase [Candidatus Aenigmarchaeota archaeon]|nr:Glu/Leu/Phe/Val dehydrogenase [Candidatus Aenigmarchaeota archaeon]
MELENFADEFGPEYVIEVYDKKVGLKGILVIDNRSLGPSKGGIRMTPTVDVSEVFRLARTMTWKNALAELPFGGAKAGIKASIEDIKNKERKKALIQAFSKALKPIVPKLYIAGPDVNTGEQEMQWFFEANGDWRACTGKPASVCMRLFGKSGEKCGIPHEFGSTGFGVAHASVIAADHIDLDIKGATIAIEGFGNVGTFASKYLSDFGAKIVAVGDSKGVIYNENGLDIEKLHDVKENTGSVVNYNPGKVLKNKEIFELTVDILIPGALPDVITKDNVNNVKAKIVVEAANIPMIPEMEEMLYKKGILVVPDFVANAGGVISSYAEYRGYNPKRMFELVEKKIKRNVKIVLDRARKDKIKPRDAALKIAQERIRGKITK